MTNLSVCVYCGSRPGARPAYAQQANRLGSLLAARDWRLVYGAGDVGLMGEVARAAQAGGGRTFGVIPTHLMDAEVGKRDLTQFVVTQTMHERKKVMFMNSDGIVVLPGGAGTLDEFFEVLTWRQLRLHTKPIVLLNTEGYWTPMYAMMERIVAEGFADASMLDFVSLAESADAAMETLAEALDDTAD